MNGKRVERRRSQELPHTKTTSINHGEVCAKQTVGAAAWHQVIFVQLLSAYAPTATAEILAPIVARRGKQLPTSQYHITKTIKGLPTCNPNIRKFKQGTVQKNISNKVKNVVKD